MNNNELINKRVKISQQYLDYLHQTLDEINLLTPKTSYLDDLVHHALSKVAQLKYHLEVADKITEKIEV